MGTAREDFLENLAAIKAASDLPALREPIVVDQEAVNVARLLRNGLAVAAFSTLEDFIKRRNEELLSFASTGPSSLANLPEALRDGATRRSLAALEALSRRSDDPIPLIHQISAMIGRTASGTVVFPSLTMHWAGSNLTGSDLNESLTMIGVSDPWAQMTGLGRRCGFQIPGGMEAAFKAMARARNEAAHAATTNTPLLSLRSFHISALGIACTYDLLASRALRLIQEAVPDSLRGTAKVRSIDISLRLVVDRGGGVWAEVRETKPKPAIKLYRDLASAQLESRSHGASRREAVVSKGRLGDPNWWISGDVAT